MAFIATCFAYRQGDCDKAYRYFRRANKLSHIKRIRRGYYAFTLHVPPCWNAEDVILAFKRAFGNALYTPPAIEELPIDVKPEPSKPTQSEALRQAPSIGAHMATLNLFREADGTYEITVMEARGFIETYQGVMRAAPIFYIEEAIVAAAARIKARNERITK